MVPTLFKIGHIWHYRFQVGGHRVQRSTRERDAKRAQRVAEQAARDARTRWAGELPTPTLAGALDDWLRLQRNRKSPAYIRSMEIFRERHLYQLRRLRVDRLTTDKVEEALAEHLKTHCRASGNHWLRNLKAVCKWCIDRRALGEMPWKIKMERTQQKPKATVPPMKLQRWLEALDQVTPDPQIRMACRLMVFLGLREMEALGARWEWLDLERGTYTPCLTKGKEAWPIPILLVREVLEPIAKTQGWMFPARDGRPHAHGFTWKAMQAANALAGVPGITPHRLRGTFATLLAQKGLNIKEIQRACRHKDPRTTWLYLGENLSIIEGGLGQIGQDLKGV